MVGGRPLDSRVKASRTTSRVCINIYRMKVPIFFSLYPCAYTYAYICSSTGGYIIASYREKWRGEWGDDGKKDDDPFRSLLYFPNHLTIFFNGLPRLFFAYRRSIHSYMHKLYSLAARHLQLNVLDIHTARKSSEHLISDYILYI